MNKVWSYQQKFIILVETIKPIIMKIYNLTERANLNGAYHDRVLECYEDYNYALVIKAKYENAGSLNTYFISEMELVEGEIGMVERDGDIMLNDENDNTIAVVDVETYVDEIPTHVDFNDRVYTTTCMSLGDVTIFGEGIHSIGFVDGLDREIQNAAEFKVEQLNEQ